MNGMVGAEFLATALDSLAPLHIHAVEYEDPTLVVIGNEWSLALLGARAWRRDGVVVTEWGEASSADTVWDLCGLDILAARFPNAECSGDCLFDLSDGGTLESRSDGSGYDAWAFRHNDLPLVFIGQ